MTVCVHGVRVECALVLKRCNEGFTALVCAEAKDNFVKSVLSLHLWTNQDGVASAFAYRTTSWPSIDILTPQFLLLFLLSWEDETGIKMYARLSLILFGLILILTNIDFIYMALTSKKTLPISF